MNREEPLRRAWYSKASMLAFPLSGWLMRDLGSIVRAPVGEITISQTKIAQGSVKGT